MMIALFFRHVVVFKKKRIQNTVEMLKAEKG